MRLWSVRKKPALRCVVGILAVALLALWTTAELVHGCLHRLSDGAPSLHAAGAVGAAPGCAVCDLDAAGTAPPAPVPTFVAPRPTALPPALSAPSVVACATAAALPTGRAPPA